MAILRFVVLFGFAFLAACGGGGGGGTTTTPPPPPPPPTTTVTLDGDAQKGPFESGATITVSAVQSTGTTGSQLATTTTADNLGGFQVTVDANQTVLVEAQGSFLNELDGTSSTTMLNLSSMMNVSSAATQTANVNVLTHLAVPRIRSLMSGGTTIQSAQNQARDEVLAALTILADPPQVSSFAGTAQYSSTQGDANSAYLVTVSAFFMERARQLASTHSTEMYAELQVLIDDLAQDLADGTVDYPAPLTALRDVAYDIEPAAIASNLENLATSEGSNLSAGDIYMFIDSDLDGVANNNDDDDDNDGIADASDAYPLDWSCYLAADGDGVSCDIDSDVPANYQPIAVTADDRGIVYLLDTVSNQIIRWSIGRQQYGFPLSIPADATAMVYSPIHDRIYVGFRSGEILAMNPDGDHATSSFATIGSAVTGVVAAGDYLLVLDNTQGWQTFSYAGALADQGSSGTPVTHYAWDDNSDRLYFVGWYSPQDIEYQEINQFDGTFGASGNSPYHGDFPMTAPLRVSSDSSVVVTGSGDFFDSATLEWRRSLPGNYTDYAWLSDDSIIALLQTGTGNRVEHRSARGDIVDYADFPSVPLNVFTYKDRVQVVAREAGDTVFFEFVPGGDIDGDHVPNPVDAFPADVAASQDSDRDGYPDAWNAGYSANDSTTSLTLDSYPNDSACFLPGHGDGTTCDIARNVPQFTPLATAVDNDGVTYAFDGGAERIHRFDSTLGYLNPLVLDDEDSDLPVNMRYSPDQDRLYISYLSGRIVYFDLTNPGDELYFTTTPTNAIGVQPAGSHLWTSGRDAQSTGRWILVFDENGESTGRTEFGAEYSTHSAWNDALDRVYFFRDGISPNDIHYQAINQVTGEPGGVVDSPYHGDYQITGPIRVSPNGDMVLLGSGDIYNANDLTWLGAIPSGFVDAQWSGDGGIVVIWDSGFGTRIERRDNTGRVVEVATTGGYAAALHRDGSDYRVITLVDQRPAYFRYTPSNDTDADGVDNATDAFPLDAAASLDSDGDGYPDDWNTGMTEADSTTGLTLDAYPNDSACYLPGHGDGVTCDVTSTMPNYIPETVEIGNDGVVYLFSPLTRRVYRWDSVTGEHLNPYVVGSDKWLGSIFPTKMLYHPGHDRIYLGYDSGDIKYIDPNAGPEEQYFSTMATDVGGLGNAGNFLMAQDFSGAWYTHVVYDINGSVRDSADWNRFSRVYEWNQALSRIYFFRDGTSPNDLHYETVDQVTGQIIEEGETPYHGTYSMIPPIRASVDGSRILLGSGDVYDAASMDRLGSIPNIVTDARWLDDGSIISIHDVGGNTNYERRDANGGLVESEQFTGAPLAILRYGSDLTIVTDGGRPVFNAHTPSDDSDGDGVLNTVDAFPLDPAASVDSDGDGYPDAWNTGMTEADSTTGLTLDAYPADSACYLLQHGDGTTCDITSTMPNYVPDSIAMDSSGIVYLFSQANRRVFRWDSVSQAHLNPIFVGTDNWLNQTSPTTMTWQASHGRLYFGYDNGDVTYVDIATGNEQGFATLAESVASLAAAGNYLVATGQLGSSGTANILDANGTLVDTRSNLYWSKDNAWNPVLERLYHLRDGVSPNDIHFMEINASTGIIGGAGESPYHGTYNILPPIRISADGSKVLLGSGDIYEATNLNWLGSIAGEFKDGNWDDQGGIVVVRDNLGASLVERRDSNGNVIDFAQYPGLPLALLPSGTDQIVVTNEGRPSFFTYVPSDDSDSDGVLNVSDAFPIDPAASVDTDGDGYPDAWNSGMSEADSTTGLTLDAYPNDAACYLPQHGDGVTCDVTSTMPDYVPASIEVGSDDTFYLFSPENQRVYRWDSTTSQHLNPLVIGDSQWLGARTPAIMTHHAAHDRLYFGYDDGQITYIDLATLAAEQELVRLGTVIQGLADAGNFLLAHASDGTDQVFNAAGLSVDSSALARFSRTYAWDPVNSRLFFFRDDSSPNDVYYRSIDQATGALGALVESPYHGSYSIQPPIRISADGARVLLGSGDIYRADDLNWLGSVQGGVADAQWLAQDSIVTLSDNAGNSRIVRRDGTGQVVEIVDLTGAPLAVRPVAAGLMVVTSRGRPAFDLYVPTDDSDSDGVLNLADAFPLDPAASVDTDGDGYPDSWNTGMTEADSTTGLVLDSYPDDSACYLPGHGDGTTCDITSTMPAYLPQSVEIDDSGVVYLFSPDNNRIYRWDSVTEEHLNPIVVGTDDWLGTSAPTIMAYHSAQFRMYLGYQNGDITYIDLAGTGGEQNFTTLAMQPRGLADVGNFLLAQDDTGAWESHHIYDAGGILRDSQEWNHYSRTYAWNPVLNRVYFFRDTTSPNDIHFEDIDQVTGLIISAGESPYHGDYSIQPPLQVSADGTKVIIGSGNIFDADTLEWQFLLPQAITDAQWLSDGRLVSIRTNGLDTAFEVRDTSYTVTSSSVISNAPIAALRYVDNIIVVTAGVRPEFTVTTP